MSAYLLQENDDDGKIYTLVSTKALEKANQGACSPEVTYEGMGWAKYP